MVSQNSINDTIEENDFSVNRSVAGTKVVSSINHSDNTNTDSVAEQLIQTGGSSGGDPYTRYLISGEQEFSTGLDNTDGNKLKIGPNAHPSTGTAAVSIKPAGDVTFNEAFEFPTTDGTSGQALVTDGAGNVDWGSTGGSGEVLQLVYAQSPTVYNTTANILADGSVPQQTEGIEILTATIIPKRATSKLLIQFSVWGEIGRPKGGTIALFRDAIASSFYATMLTSQRGTTLSFEGGQASGLVVIDALSTASTTIKMRAGRSFSGVAGDLTINRVSEGAGNCFGGVQLITMTITEIAV